MNVGHASACRRAEARHLGATEERVSFARIGRLNACASRLAFRVAGNPACRRPFRPPFSALAIYRMNSKAQVGQAFSLRRASARLLGTRRIFSGFVFAGIPQRSLRN